MQLVIYASGFSNLCQLIPYADFVLVGMLPGIVVGSAVWQAIWSYILSDVRFTLPIAFLNEIYVFLML
jgi:hypothetical protein